MRVSRRDSEELRRVMWKEVGGDGESFGKSRRLVRVDLDEAGEGVSIGSEETARDGIVRGRLHGGCFEGGDGFLAYSCSSGLSERERM